MKNSSIRLAELKNMALNDTYQHIWDCCCDHGYLGMALLGDGLHNLVEDKIAHNRQAKPHIHFVDTLAHIMRDLEAILHQQYTQDDIQYAHTYCISAADIPITDFKQDKQLVIIAGVSTKLTAELVSILVKKAKALDQPLEFLLCPMHRMYTLRQDLIALDVHLKKEILVKENKKFYELLLITTDTRSGFEPIHEVGQQLWHNNKQELQEYLTQTLAHYTRVKRGLVQKQQTAKIAYNDRIMTAYKSVEL